MNREVIKKHIEADVPLLILGSSGWGKSAIVEDVAKELGLPVVIANANSWTAEDFGGLVRPGKTGKYYDYLPPKWAIDNKEKKFLFFIDEINQADVSVLHTLYRVVLNREVARIKLNMIVISAGNTTTENPYLNELPLPLLKRFSKYSWVNEHNDCCDYLNKKYILDLKEIYTTPRETEMAIKLYRVGDENSARDLGGAQLISYLKKNRKSEGEKLIKELSINEAKKRNGIL